MSFKKVLVVIMIMMTMIACQKSEEKTTSEETNYVGHKVTVEEAIDGKTYTYLRVTEKDSEHWVAISRRDTKVGETLYYLDALEMPNFESKELERTFDAIRFVAKISNQPIQMGGAMASSKARSGKAEPAKTSISVEKAEGGITIAELFANREVYKDKEVTIKGKIVKYNAEIMGLNWAHLQDGTSDDGNFDLTVTTQESLNVGDVVTFTGKISISKDIGSGYFYEVIMELASTEKGKAI